MPFTPIQTLLGGYLLHLSSSSLLSETGRVFGISGIVDNALFGDKELWRYSTLAGLLSGPLVASVLGEIGVDSGAKMWAGLGWERIGLAGLLVGMGSRLGSGCTSGHFLCGVSRLSRRSLVATATFFTTAVFTANMFPAPIPDFPNSDFIFKTAFDETARQLVVSVTAVVAVQTACRSFLLRHYAKSPKDKSEEIKTASPPTVIRQLPYFVQGLTFSLGLIISGMVSPLKVMSFLQPFSPNFDPSLAMVVIAGVIPNGIHYFYSTHKTIFPWEQWRVPTRKDIDWRLLLGSVLFGAGWGLAGVCPGPAIVGLTRAGMEGSGVTKIAGWVAAMATGMALARNV